jgi:hypothetical protein
MLECTQALLLPALRMLDEGTTASLFSSEQLSREAVKRLERGVTSASSDFMCCSGQRGAVRLAMLTGVWCVRPSPTGQ